MDIYKERLAKRVEPVQKFEFDEVARENAFYDQCHYRKWKLQRAMEDMKFLFVEEPYKPPDINAEIDDDVAEKENRMMIAESIK